MYKKESNDSSDNPGYETVNLSKIPLEGNKLFLDRVNTDTLGNVNPDYSNDSLSTIEHSLVADGVKIK